MTRGERGLGRALSLGEADEAILRRAGRIRLTAEDVVLLLLRADPRPVRGADALAGMAYLAVTGPLAESGVEPIAFRRGRGGRPRSDHVDRALEQLAFTGNVAVSGGRTRAGAAVTITPRGRGRIADKYGRLPAAARSALGRGRAEWAASPPACRMQGGAYVHNRELLGGPAPGPDRDRDRDRAGSPAGGRRGSYSRNGAPSGMRARSWSSPSVKGMAGSEDPIAAVTARARRMVVKAMDDGWSGPPYEPARLAQILGMDIRQSEDVADARLVPSGRGGGARAIIEYNPNRPRTRVRFSIAHEIAHTLFPDHAERIRNRSYDTALNTDREVEMLCNMAAAEILMPVAPGGGLEKTTPTMENVVHMRDKFGVSTEAMMIRLPGITAHPVAVFCAARRDDARDSPYVVEYALSSASTSPPLRPGTSLRGMGVLSECTAVGYTTRMRREEMPGTGETRRVQCIGVPPHRGMTYPRVMGIMRPVPAGGRASPPAIEHVIGDATRPVGGGKKIIAHVANDKTGRWGRGFGLALTRAFGGIRADFLGWSKDNLRLGNAHTFDAGAGLAVFSMVAQKGLPDPPRRTVRYAHLAACLDELAALSRRTEASVHMPLIGTGYAGGSWDVVRDLLNRHLVQRGVRVTVYSLPGSKRPAPAASLMDYIADAAPGA